MLKFCPIITRNERAYGRCMGKECMWYRSFDENRGRCAILDIAMGLDSIDAYGGGISRALHERGERIEREIAGLAAVVEEQGTKLRSKVIIDFDDLTHRRGEVS